MLGGFEQGILKGEVSLYHWPPVWLVWNQVNDNWQFLFYLQNRLIQTSQTGGQWYSDTPPFSIPCFELDTYQLAYLWVIYLLARVPLSEISCELGYLWARYLHARVPLS